MLKKIAFTLFFAAQSSTGAWASVTENVKNESFPVTVNDDKVQEAIKAAFSQVTMPAKYHPMSGTAWAIRWTFETEKYGMKNCRVNWQKTNVTLDVTMHLPQLSGWSPQQAAFDTLVAKEKVHQEGHLAIAREAAKAIDAAINAVSDVSCETIYSVIGQAAQNAYNNGLTKDREYDTTTEYGEKQSAWK
jgi:predicted secreted Zn-dependent protease